MFIPSYLGIVTEEGFEPERWDAGVRKKLKSQPGFPFPGRRVTLDRLVFGVSAKITRNRDTHTRPVPCVRLLITLVPQV